MGFVVINRDELHSKLKNDPTETFTSKLPIQSIGHLGTEGGRRESAGTRRRRLVSFLFITTVCLLLSGYISLGAYLFESSHAEIQTQSRPSLAKQVSVTSTVAPPENQAFRQALEPVDPYTDPLWNCNGIFVNAPQRPTGCIEVAVGEQSETFGHRFFTPLW